MDLQAEFGLSYLFIAHDLAVVEHICHRVAVMYLGRIVELAPRRALFAHPQHPYTGSAAVRGAGARPRPGDPARSASFLPGDVPSPINPPAGCRFHTRCPYVFDRCRNESPELRELLARPPRRVSSALMAANADRRCGAQPFAEA